ncbi:unnamed protein product [Nesidiocoris tenuis]|uniref:Uncharacterized protein n=1 Tax=Nesidiocoris tenuis TaxID=355587 RepID=A0A6H5GLF8_9HEMI|nr:unnamed protein product [Nesidiocoris tenuis]
MKTSTSSWRCRSFSSFLQLRNFLETNGNIDASKDICQDFPPESEGRSKTSTCFFAHENAALFISDIHDENKAEKSGSSCDLAEMRTKGNGRRSVQTMRIKIEQQLGNEAPVDLKIWAEQMTTTRRKYSKVSRDIQKFDSEKTEITLSLQGEVKNLLQKKWHTSRVQGLWPHRQELPKLQSPWHQCKWSHLQHYGHQRYPRVSTLRADPWCWRS